MRAKGMEDLAAFSAREIKRATLELRKSVWLTRSTFPSDVTGRPDPFALHRQPSSSNFFASSKFALLLATF